MREKQTKVSAREKAMKKSKAFAMWHLILVRGLDNKVNIGLWGVLGWGVSQITPGGAQKIICDIRDWPACKASTLPIYCHSSPVNVGFNILSCTKCYKLKQQMDL